VFERRSALFMQLQAGGRECAHGERGLKLREIRGWHLAQLGVFPHCEAGFAAAVQPILGVDLPLTAVTTAGARIYRIAADQYWVVGRDGRLIDELAHAVTPTVGAVTCLSNSRARIAIEGRRAREFLQNIIVVDLDADVFKVDEAIQTSLYHTGVLLERTGTDRYELYVLRTYAASTWAWLIDAALPFGYDLDGAGA
jgi:heterotetrameric sarcosine oxidase gamma subunit